MDVEMQGMPNERRLVKRSWEVGGECKKPDQDGSDGLMANACEAMNQKLLSALIACHVCKL
jgi:hypothetical protein